MRLNIRWKPHFTDTEYGFVGEIKAFSIVDHDGAYTLYPRLPDRKGTTQVEKFWDIDKAKARAEELLQAFLKDFLADAQPAKPAVVGAAREAS